MSNVRPLKHIACPAIAEVTNLQLYVYTKGRQPLTFSARTAAGAREFSQELSSGAVAIQNRWDNAMLFVRCGVDWPAWQDLHRRTYESRTADPLGFYDPWKMTDEFETLGRTKPIDFDGMYQSLSVLPARVAVQYITVAYHSRQLLERKSLFPTDALSFQQLLDLTPSGLVAPATVAPIDLLLSRAKSADLAHCFAQLGLQKAKNVQLATQYIEQRRSSSEVVAALQSAPRWRDLLYLMPPAEHTWEQFQDFRFIVKGMAQDFRSYMDGFPIFEERRPIQ